MRRNLIPAPFAIVLLATVLSVPVSPAEFPSRVDRVVLYPDMAEVTRVVEVDRPEATVVLSGLTPNLLSDTLSARVASGGSRITGVSAEDLFRTEPVDERVGELARRIEELSDGKRRAEEAAAAGRREKELLERGVLAIYAPGEATKDGEKGRPPRLSVAEVDAALSLYRARVEALDGSVFANDRKVRDLEKKDRGRPTGTGQDPEPAPDPGEGRPDRSRPGREVPSRRHLPGSGGRVRSPLQREACSGDGHSLPGARRGCVAAHRGGLEGGNPRLLDRETGENGPVAAPSSLGARFLPAPGGAPDDEDAQ